MRTSHVIRWTLDVARAYRDGRRTWWQRFLARVGRSDSRNSAGAGAHR